MTVRSPRGVEQAVPGRVLENEHGSFYQVEVTIPGASIRGGAPLGDALNVRGHLLAIAGRDPDLAGFAVEDTVFLDTETTGLAGGTGTYAFLVGIGAFEAGDFVIRQFFMRDLPEEKALMSALAAVLRRYGWSVTFNGKSFDVPLLRTRFILCRLPPPVDGIVHFDLLHACRRLWRSAPFAGRLGLGLGALEAGLLGHVRPFDVPSWRVPEIYFDYLRTGDAGELAAVFAHNVEDILSMVSLLSRVHGAMNAWRSPGAVDPYLLLGIARTFELEGQSDQALAAYRAALSGMLEPDVADRASLAASFIHKRAGHWDQAMSIWRGLADGSRRPAAAACVELAKYHEHHAADFPNALAYCIRAAEVAREVLPTPGGQLSEWGLDARAARLRQKLAAPAGRGLPPRARPGAELLHGPLGS